ncbi:MFS transporter [Fictibacillus barbaricus]|uniref:MFS family permease n=1 Tax=Fictibacillus barbaricus TaxID=182136 RepID=A0ABU1U185_9BACL|nr:MFS transporter [Fictibacillus barbaricus]MDR7073218.1 MFS family permease [Fictibacillus barbaricus]
MAIWKRNLWVLWVGVFLTSASYSMVVPFLPLFLLQIGVHEHTEIWSGLIFSSAFLAGAIASPYWGMMADKYGRKPMIIRAGTFLFIIYTLTAFVTNAYQLIGLRIAQGLLTGYIPGAIALIGTNTPKKNVGYAMAMISTAGASGGIMGPLLGGGLAELFGNRWAFASGGFFSLISTLLVIFWVTEEKFTPSTEKGSVLKDLQAAAANKPFMNVLFLSIITGTAVLTIEPVLPLHILRISGSNDNTALLAGIVFSLPGIASILFAAYWGRMSDRIGFQTVLMIGLLGGGIGTIAQAWFDGIWGFSSVRFIYGIFFCGVFPALNGLIVQTTADEFRGRAFGLQQTATQIGAMLGPLIGGVIGGFFPVSMVFIITGLMLLIAMFTAYKFRTNSENAELRKASGA